MATYDCDDLRITFARHEGLDNAYIVRAKASDGQEIETSFSLPMTPMLLEQAVVGLSRSRDAGTTAETEVRANAEKLGGDLAAALFGADLSALYERARRTAAEAGRGLRLTLSLASTPELLSVPWELLYRRPNFLASQRRSPIVRYLEVGDVPPPQRIDGPVRILGVVASPTGLPTIDVHSERARVESALSAMVGRGLVSLEWCDPATPRSLRERLRDGSFHVLHYVGHSDFTAEGDGLLFLTNESGGPAQVTEAVLTTLLGDQTSLRLAVLNSCEGARSTLTDPFAGIATSIVALGVPAVIAMQFVISDRAAIVFAEELFTSLIGRQYPVDAAVAEARKAVFTEVNEIEWATPVLFLRSDDGRLFDFAVDPTPLPLVVEAAPIRVEDAQPPAPASAPTRPPAEPLSFAPPPARNRRRPAIIAAAAALVAIAVVATVVAMSGSDDEDQTAPTTQPTITTADATSASTATSLVDVATTTISGELPPVGGTSTTTTSTPVVTTTTGIAVTTTTPTVIAPRFESDRESTATCEGRSVPQLADPDLSQLDDAQRSAFRRIQEWASLLASGRSGEENATGNDDVWNLMTTIYPAGGTNPISGPEKLTSGQAYGNMVGNNLVYVRVMAEQPLMFRLGSLVYDGLDDSSCRTRLLCVTARYEDDHITSYRWGGGGYLFDELNADGSQQRHWHTPDEFAYLTLGAPIAQRIDEVPTGKCGEP